ncbi:hypothetical protein [Isoptericola sp. AK164]|uniref:hypothetical protein n=1 Tax=Isoptericola sp. AK164 TaxID=3024246 RepID=UPI00241850EA|nr:hypothetical protein [Isoptericola sp. AK164]
MTPPIRRGALLAGPLTAALVLAGCTDDPATPDAATVPIERTPDTAVEAPPAVDTDGLRVPLQVDTVRLVDPGWDAAPQTADGIALGVDERDGLQRFTAVAADGEALWSAERPASGTGHAVTTTSAGRALAVLADTGADTAAESTTATAYDLRTGEPVWGPVDVPGPPAGPGLVFAESGSEPADAAGSRVVLDADTGEPVTLEADVSVLGEHRGTVLVRDGDEVVARTADGEARWRLDTADQGWEAGAVTASLEPSPGPGTVRLRTGEASEALVDLDDGTVLADGFTDVGVDPTTGTVVTVDADGLRGLDAAGTELWTTSTAQETTIEGVSGALVYLRVGDSLRAHNVVTGNVAEAYDPEGTGDLVAPVAVTDAGSIVLSDYSGYLLATTDTVAPPAP